VYFGGTSPEKFVGTQIPKYETSYIAKAYLQQSNQLFVTRVLGLSGYDAGPSWSIVTMGNVDPSTIVPTTSGASTFTFTGTSGLSSSIQLVGVPSPLSTVLNDTYTNFNNTTSTLYSDIQTFIFNQISLFRTASASSGTTAQFWGSLSGNMINYVTGSSVNTVTGYNETYAVSSVDFANNTLSDSSNDPWYYSLFTYSKVGDVSTYSGFGFGISLDGITTGATAGTYTGVCNIGFTNYSGTPYTDFNDLVVATLRSRGISTYSSTNAGPTYEVSGTSDVQLITNGLYSGITKDPFETFVVSGVSSDGDNFSFETSLLTTDSKYISKVFGKSNFGKDRTEVPLFVEEVYPALLTTGYRQGKIRGIYSDLIELGGVRDNDTDSIAFFLEQFQTPETPYLVSELRGNKVYKLFKAVLISDGNAANRLVKFL
jgi:hypothetical protein